MQKFQVRFKAVDISEEFKFGHDNGKMKEKQLKKTSCTNYRCKNLFVFQASLKKRGLFMVRLTKRFAELDLRTTVLISGRQRKV